LLKHKFNYLGYWGSDLKGIFVPSLIYLIYHLNKNDDTEHKMPYYLKRFLIKQFLNICSTNLLRTVSVYSERKGELAILSLSRVSKGFKLKDGIYQAVEDVSLEVKKGSIHGIIGESGAGKSTLLRLINLLEQPDQGTVTVDGQVLTQMPSKQLRKAREKIGMIFQQFNLVNNVTVNRNISIPLELAGVPKAERLKRVKECLDFVGLADKAGQYPAQLSGGQRQRVAIARALSNSPGLLLCDEPTSSLDPGTTEDILDVLKHINLSLGVTIVIVTHEMDVVKSICTHVSVMEEGRIVDSFSRGDGNFRPAAVRTGSYRDQILGKAGETHV
jgi:D-methionine transport system ATP-binding protein